MKVIPCFKIFQLSPIACTTFTVCLHSLILTYFSIFIAHNVIIQTIDSQQIDSLEHTTETRLSPCFLLIQYFLLLLFLKILNSSLSFVANLKSYLLYKVLLNPSVLAQQ